MPCCRLYGWLGVKLAQEKKELEEERERDARSKESSSNDDGKPNPFSAWIETYSSLEYHAATCKLEALLDRLAEGLSAEERGEFKTFFLSFLFIYFFRFSTSKKFVEQKGAMRLANGARRCLLPALQIPQLCNYQRQRTTLFYAPGVCSWSLRTRRTEQQRRRGQGMDAKVSVATVGELLVVEADRRR